MKKSGWIVALALLTAVPDSNMNAQKEVRPDFYGFVLTQTFLDTRKGAASSDGLVYLYPLDDRLNASKEDLNAVPQFSYFINTVRLGLNLKGPQLFGAESRAKAEIELASNAVKTDVFTYRHCFMALDWQNSSLVLGQTWHPMSELFPTMVGVSNGLPFNSLNRSPQLRYDYYLGQNRELRLTAAALYQLLYTTVGPDGKTNEYHKNSGLPALYVGADFRWKDLSLTAGVEWQRIVPYMDVNNKKFYMNAVTAMLQAKYRHDKLAVNAKAYLGQNSSHLGIISGFGKVATIEREYAPITTFSSWAEVRWGDKLSYGLYGGYLKNLGSAKRLETLYMNVNGAVGSMWRISPSLQYTVSNFVFGLENEITSVAYGVREANATVSDTHGVVNNRLLLSVRYNF